MKTFILFSILASAMSAQDFHGVTIGGDVARPTIVNNSLKPVMSYVIRENFVGGGGADHMVHNIDWMAKGTPIQPGEERSAIGLASDFHSGRIGTQPKLERPIVESRELIAVLFADGSFTGPEVERQAFSNLIYHWRSMARDTQYLTEKYRVMEEDRRAVREKGDMTRFERAILAHVLLSIRNDKGEAESEAALARLAAMPDVEKGAQQ